MALFDKNLKNFFAKKDADDIRETDSDDYKVEKNRRMDMIFRILSLLVAIVIWISIVIGDTATKDFLNFSVLFRGGDSIRATHDFSYDFTQVNFQIQGKGTQISQLDENNIVVYVDLDSIDKNLLSTDEVQFFDLPINYGIKSGRDIVAINNKQDGGIVFAQKSREYIRVTVTKKGFSTKKFQNFPVTFTFMDESGLSQTHDLLYETIRVDFEIRGRTTQINQLTEQDFLVYVDFSEIMNSPEFSDTAEQQVFELPLVYKMKYEKDDVNVLFIRKSKDTIKVTITKKTS